MDMKGSKDEALEGGGSSLPAQVLEGYSRRFDDIMWLAFRECPMPEAKRTSRGYRVFKGKERCLIERLAGNKDSVCRFVCDFNVPFNNNQAEQDVRNVKTKTKVSGCFRSRAGAQRYLDVMSYLSTGRKHGVNAFEALMAAYEGNPDIVL